jgi:amino acid adenylation domain-containing protein
LIRLALFRVGPAAHILAWTFHHLLLDEPAKSVVLNEVFQIYEALSRGDDLDLAPPPPCRDSMIKWLRKRDWAAAEMFWKEQLKGFRAPTPRVAAPAPDRTGKGSRPHTIRQSTLSPGQTERLRSLARRHGLTVGTLLQGAWAILLHRYSREEDVVFGIVRPCRRDPVEDPRSTVGLFTNILPVRLVLTPELRLIDGLRNLQAQAMEIRDHEHTSVAEIQRWSEVPPGQALFESLFSFQDPPWDTALRAQGGKWAQREFSTRRQPHFPLWIEISGGAELAVRIGHTQGHFTDLTDVTSEEILGHFLTVLESMAADLSQPVADVPLLTAPERQRLLVGWNATHAECLTDGGVVELFEAQVERTPNAVALVHGKEEVSYRELDNQANRVSRHLRSLAVGPDVPVGICLPPSVNRVAGLLGILKAGGACLPLDPANPRERLQFMLQDSGARVLLTVESLKSGLRFQSRNGDIVCLDQPRNRLSQAEPPALPRPNVSPGNLACILYAPVSTGAPKGVELCHRSLLNLVAWHQRTYGITAGDRVAHFADAGSDASFWELWPCLVAGARVHIVEDHVGRSAPALVEWINRQHITVALLPTGVAEETLAAGWPEGTPLRTLLTGGDRLHRPAPARLPFRWFNHYGTAETTLTATCARIAPGPPGSHGAVDSTLIGRPVANVQVFVLDRGFNPVPVGVPGELFIGGDNLARAYRNHPALTAERFVPHPFSDAPGARLYRTGDIVRWRPDGNLEFIRRADRQFNVHGRRVEPGEIESRLNQHPGVRESLVVTRDDGRNELVAYLLSRFQPAPTNKELSDFVRVTLPEYMVPSAFVFVEAWPLTPLGQVDHRALPVPDQPHRPRHRAFLAPRSQLEDTAARIWSEVLGRDRVGVHDNFFELGGHSLAAAHVVSRLKEALNVPLSVRSLFERPTVTELAREIERSMTRSGPQRASRITRVQRDAYRMRTPPAEIGANSSAPR